MHVVVLGAGYAGIALVRRLERVLPDDVELTLVDGGETHLVQHLLHRVVREPALESHITVPVEDCCRRASFRRARVRRVDVDSGVVRLEDGTLEYDVGVVCLGAQTEFYDLPGLERNARPLKQLADAQQIREEFLQVREQSGRVVIGGAGLSGVQIAGELAELAGDENDVDIVLFEQRSTVAPEFPTQFQEAVTEELENRDVQVRTNTAVESVDESRVVTAGGNELRYDQLIWTGGIRGQDALSGSRPQVRSTLRLGQRTFGAGDAVRVIDDRGRQAPASAQTAVRQAKVAARNVAALVDHERNATGFEPRLSRYTYESLGWVVTVGDGTVAQVGSRVLRGAPARALKTTIGVQHLAAVGAAEDAVEFAQQSLT